MGLLLTSCYSEKGTKHRFKANRHLSTSHSEISDIKNQEWICTKYAPSPYCVTRLMFLIISVDNAIFLQAHAFRHYHMFFQILF
jgi:hypothetical protein